MHTEKRFGIHYITSEPKKLIESFKRREKKALQEIEENKLLEEKYGDIPIPEEWSDRDASLEQTIVYLHDGILSVFPDTKTAWQKRNGAWVRFDYRPKSLAQKVGALLAIEDSKGDIGVEFWQHGEHLAFSYDKRRPILLEYLERYFHCDKVETGKALEIEDPLIMLDKLEECLGFPLFIPNGWEERWNPKRLTPHLLFLDGQKNS